MPADVDVFAVRVTFRVRVFRCCFTVKANAQHIQRKVGDGGGVHQVEKFLRAAGIRPDGELFPGDHAAGISFNEFKFVAFDARTFSETTAFHATGAQRGFSHCDDLPLRVRNVHAGDETQKFRAFQQGFTQGNAARFGQGKSAIT
ncbi:hypothetical protein BvCmsJ77A_00191 [Escherichia coli]|nr:hypothetical protein BvCmsJ77A_00191 [Escherichia coli]